MNIEEEFRILLFLENVKISTIFYLITITTSKNIKEISQELGFQTNHYFSLIFKKRVGLNPSEFRKRIGGN